MSISRWVDKEDVVYMCNRILLSHKKHWNYAICSNMDTPRDYHPSKQVRKRKTNATWYVGSKIWQWSYLWNRHRLTHRTDLWWPRRRVSGGEKDWKFGISRCKLVYIRWISSKVLLYSAGNYICYPVINHNGKSVKKKTCATETLLFSRD